MRVNWRKQVTLLHGATVRYSEGFEKTDARLESDILLSLSLSLHAGDKKMRGSTHLGVGMCALHV